MVWRTLPCALIVLSGIAASGCGSSSGPSTSATGSHPSPAPRAHRAATGRPHVGLAQRVTTSGETLSVTVIRVIDPLAGSGAALQPGTRAVGVLVHIVNHGPGIYDSSATGDISVVPSTGTATPVFAPHGVCQTPLRDFDNYVVPAAARSGCVAFALETGAKLVAVRFSPHGRADGRVSWIAAG